MTQSEVPHVDAATLRAAAAKFPTGVAIVSSHDGHGLPVGCTISSFLSVSLDPPIVAVSLAATASTLEHISQAGNFGISVLSSRQQTVANLFASREASYESRFSAVRWRAGLNNVPLLENGLSTLSCSVSETVSAGDHTLVLGRVHEVFCQGWGGPLVHHQGTLGSLRAV